MTLLPIQTLKTAAHSLASAQSRAWLQPALLLLALSSVFMFGIDQFGYFNGGEYHGQMSTKNIAISENLSIERHFLMFMKHQPPGKAGNPTFTPYNRFPIGGYALIKLTILPFGDNISSRIYAAQILMLLCFSAAALLAYLSLRRIASNRWIALTAVLLAFSSAYCLYHSDMISNEGMIDLFAVMLVFHGMAVFEQDGRFRQLPIKACIALLLGWHVYALLLPFIAFGLMRELIELIKARSSISTPPTPALHQLKRAALSLLRSRYLTLGVITLIFGASVLTINFTNEYFALNRETPLTELPSFISMMTRTGVEPFSSPFSSEEEGSEFLSWPAFPELQFYRIGAMSLPFAFFPSYVSEGITLLDFIDSEDEPLPRLFVILGIAVSVASLIGLLFVRRHTILLSTLTLSGFCWALPMRHTTAYPFHSFEAVFYIGVTLTLFSLALICLRKFSREWLVAALSAAALPIFVFSALRMAQLNDTAQIPEVHKAVAADFESIRNMTQDGDAIFMRKNLDYRLRQQISVFSYYIVGYLISKTRMYEEEIVQRRAPDFIITNERPDGLASLTPKNRLLFLYEWNGYQSHLDELIEESEPLIRSRFDVHLIGNTLMYVKDDCSEDDIREKFFLGLYPVDESALPDNRRQSGFDNLDFYFKKHAFRYDDRCIAIAPLPNYDIARISTGQFTTRADGSFENTWKYKIHLMQ